MRVDGRRWYFSTGRYIESEGMYTCDPESLWVAEGHDNALIIKDGDGRPYRGDDLTAVEAVELGEAMVEHWKRFIATAKAAT